MTIQILGDLPKGVCLSCGMDTARIKCYTLVEGYDGMTELKHKINCFKCEMNWRRINKYQKEIMVLNDKITNEEFILFCRKIN
jgi:hypothetical protein